MGAGGYDKLAATQPNVADLDRARIQKHGVAGEYVHAFVPQRLGRLPYIYLFRHRFYPGHHRFQVYSRFHCVQPIAVGGAHVVCNLCGLDQRFAGDAPGPGAVTPDAFHFGQRYPQAQLRSEPSSGKAGGTPADDDQVVGLVHGIVPLCQRGCLSYSRLRPRAVASSARSAWKRPGQPQGLPLRHNVVLPIATDILDASDRQRKGTAGWKAGSLALVC